MGRLEAKLRAKMVPSWVPRWRFWGSTNEAKRKVLRLYAKSAQRLRTVICPLDVNGFLRFRGSMLGGKIGLRVSWRVLGASWRRLKASWRPLGASYGELGGILGRLKGGWRRDWSVEDPRPGADFRPPNE